MHLTQPCVVVLACNPNTLGGGGRWITWGQGFQTSLANMVKPHLYKNTKINKKVFGSGVDNSKFLHIIGAYVCLCLTKYGKICI